MLPLKGEGFALFRYSILRKDLRYYGILSPSGDDYKPFKPPFFGDGIYQIFLRCDDIRAPYNPLPINISIILKINR